MALGVPQIFSPMPDSGLRSARGSGSCLCVITKSFVHFIRPLVASICLVGSAEAITLADLAPAALPGKTLRFSFEGGDAVPPPTGTWTAAFTATAATVSNFPGVAGSHVSTWKYVGASFPDSYGYTLSASPAFGGKAASLDMWVSVVGARFYLTVDGVGSYGAVELAPTPSGPEISIQQAGNELVDGKSKRDFGKVKVGKSGIAKKFTIRNTGTAALKNIAIGKSGANAADYVVSAPSKTTIPAGGSATFTVTFKPKAKATPKPSTVRKAGIAISSNDKDENPFNLILVGEALAK